MYKRQGKYNLTNLASNGVPQPEQEQVLRRLLGALRLPDTLAGRIIEVIAASQPPAPAANAPTPAQGGQAPQARAPLPLSLIHI